MMSEEQRTNVIVKGDLEGLSDLRSDEIKKRFPLRKIRLDKCICGHDDGDHTFDSNVDNLTGACAICVCKGFQIND